VLVGEWEGDEVVRTTEPRGRLALRVLLWAGVLVVGPVLVVLVWLGSRTGFEPVPLPPTATSEAVLAARDAASVQQEEVLGDALRPVRTATGGGHLATGREASCEETRPWPRRSGTDVGCHVATVVVAGPLPVADARVELAALHQALLAAGFEEVAGRPTLVDVLADQGAGDDGAPPDPALLEPVLLEPALLEPALLEPALLEPAVYEHADGVEVTVHPTRPASGSGALRWSLPDGRALVGPGLDALVPAGTYAVGFSTEDHLTF